MRRFFTVLVVVAVVTGSIAAQESVFRFASNPFAGTSRDGNTESMAVRDSGENLEQTTIESYESWPSADGQSAVQKKAMYRAEQRELRIAARKWYGFSQSRPVVTAVPYMTSYALLGVGHHWHPHYSWYGTAWR